METKVLEDIIVGRVEPHIYAFSTAEISDSLKVGDTYRPVAQRLKEWQNYFPDLKKEYECSAMIDEKRVYFRDFSVHAFLENVRHRHRLIKSEFPNGVYCSTEFFHAAVVPDVEDAVKDIREDFFKKGGRYQFYNEESRLPETYEYSRTESFPLRPNQQIAVEAFKKAVMSGRTNLLMYAVMRFGKSFTALCCALALKKKPLLVLVVSAKADVREEWKRTVESHEKFVDFKFLDAEALKEAEILTKTLQASSVVLFLTLQDLQGEEVKIKHREVFEKIIDLLIVDETHFGARAEKYGQVLRELGKMEVRARQNEQDNDDFVEASEADHQLKVLNARIRLHLSGTPYRILMSSEFTREDIIAFCQFSDIVQAQEDWDREHVLDEETPEWKNPYFGFPQMIRFAFHPNEASRKKLKDLRDRGVAFAFSELLRPMSLLKKDTEFRHKFKHEREILELLEVIDGSREDEELFGFLDYDRIKSGQMCHHMVMVLPFCASCDAMEKLIEDHRNQFRNLKDYEILNISGLDDRKSFKTPRLIKEYIHLAEVKNRKTLTLTVNRMLTGSTVKEWDTMLFLRDTASPQEYDQAIFRLQNAYVKRYVNGEKNIQFCMKPQTLLVDFDPDRMFSMQETKAQIYNANVEEAGNSRLRERLERELRISPIITMNAGKMRKIQAADVMDAVREYSRTRGVAEVTREIPVDLSLLDYEDIKQAITRENELGSRVGLTIRPVKDGGDNLAFDGCGDDDITDGLGESTNTENTENGSEGIVFDPVKQFQSYYARILFFAFLTDSDVKSLKDIVEVMSQEDNLRIASHVGISAEVLKSIQTHINIFVLRSLDYKIQNLNQLSKDRSLQPLERAQVAVHKFGRLGESEIITPKKVCEDMVALIPDEAFQKAVDHNYKFLDIAGKAGEFALAIYQRFMDLGYDISQIRDLIYTIPTSGLAYEFTLMIYRILGLSPENVAVHFNSYDLLSVRNAISKLDVDLIAGIVSQHKKFNCITINDKISEGEDNVIFEAVLGNPPYQMAGGSGGTNDAPIYQDFVWAGQQITHCYFSFITPARWFSGGRENILGPFRKEMLTSGKIHDMTVFMDSHDLFPTVEIKGGLCYFSGAKNYSGDCKYQLIQNGGKICTRRDFSDASILIREPVLADIVKKVTRTATHFVSEIISGDTPFGIPSNPRNSAKKQWAIYAESSEDHDVRLFYIDRATRKTDFIARNCIKKNVSSIDMEKVFIPEGYGAGESFPHQILGVPEYGGRQSVCSQSYLYAEFASRQEAYNFIAYLHTKFLRVLVSAIKISQHAMSKTYGFVPIQDFSVNSDIDWSRSVVEIDKQLYNRYGLSEEERQFIEDKIKPME